MDDFATIIAGLDGLSLVIGAIIGLLAGVGLLMLTRYSMKRSFDEALAAQKDGFDSALSEMKASFSSLSSEALTKNQQEFLTLADRELGKKTEQHATELESKKELIDQSLDSMSKSMSETLNTVPLNLERNENRVTEVLDKSTKDLKESNQNYLTQLSEKAETQTEKHNKELESKKELIDQRLTNMDAKLGKVEQLVQELQTDRKEQYGALGQQLQDLTATTSSLQKALADNRARGQWGERMAEDLLSFMGLVEGVNYVKQELTGDGSRPDFTFLFANQKSLNMDAKFPLDNYLRYIEADNEAERKEFSQKFLRDVSQRVSEIQKRGYIAAETLDCVLIFIPNEQIYRFIFEQDQTIIEDALRHKVIICSPLTLYIVLAVIRQAAQNFNIEQRSREIIEVVDDIRIEWTKYTDQMDKLERRFKGMNDDFHTLTGTRTRQLDRKFVKIDCVIKSNDLQYSGEPSTARFLDTKSGANDELPF